MRKLLEGNTFEAVSLSLHGNRPEYRDLTNVGPMTRSAEMKNIDELV